MVTTIHLYLQTALRNLVWDFKNTLFTGSTERSFTFSVPHAFRLTVTETELGTFTSAGYSWFTSTASAFCQCILNYELVERFRFAFFSRLSFVTVQFHIKQHRKSCIWTNPMWKPLLTTRGIRTETQTAAEICSGLILPTCLHMYQDTVGSMNCNFHLLKLQTGQFPTLLKNINALNCIIDRAGEIKGVQQICLTEGCDGQ